ncbi:NUDIX hydrolase [Escherichia coli O25]|uniref:NUDIX hydrolase n=1 Tax=Escherichia coli TaxID=562 RepID=A0A7D7PF47_ECOLX|nr:NUDIX hydrolase [Escherichia coli]EEZ5707338.1 NUDIX hydrolase [Escherichia coli O25]EEV7369681.1 NUDIX hydrolase [Escherichia coli]EEV7704136.1 NUDIX hydrolase [Escherichia coli]EEV9046121.1 NUDIX hydrolase [Escherichia coli]EEV9048615.1 NUDIX hydrolase [Escherichia coli]
MPASKEDLRLKLMEVVNALSESQGSTPQEIIEILNAIPAQDFTKADEDNANQNIVASVEDESSLAEAQAKADSAYSNMGRRAPAPFAGEKSMDYRKRALIGAQKLAKKFSDVDIRSVSDSATLAVLEDQIYQAAKDSVQWAVENTPGYLRKTVRMDEAGRRITEYQGDPNNWLSAFKIPPRRLVKINVASLAGA